MQLFNLYVLSYFTENNLVEWLSTQVFWAAIKIHTAWIRNLNTEFFLVLIFLYLDQKNFHTWKIFLQYQAGSVTFFVRWLTLKSSLFLFVFKHLLLHEKCLYSEVFWSIFSRIWTEYRPENSKHGHFLHSVLR